jgi:adenine-specific DNA-methyltransferase
VLLKIKLPVKQFEEAMQQMNRSQFAGSKSRSQVKSLPLPCSNLKKTSENKRYPYAISSDIEDAKRFINSRDRCFLFQGDTRDFLNALPNESIQLIITSPPYNIGKAYEEKKTLKEYLALQAEVIDKCVRVLSPTGSICWEVGNHIVGSAEILPLDIPLHEIFAQHQLRLRNRIVWHFGHGLHCKKRFSGRYEVIMWYTKKDDYHFNLDAVRVPQKYPGKRYYKGPKIGELSSNPLGKNPDDVWIFPNVKHNHREWVNHPCQFPIELVDRMLLATTRPNDIVLDPFAGVSSALVAALLKERRSCGAEIVKEYVEISGRRIEQAFEGTLPVRPPDMPVYIPRNEKVAQLPKEFEEVRKNKWK